MAIKTDSSPEAMKPQKGEIGPQQEMQIEQVRKTMLHILPPNLSNAEQQQYLIDNYLSPPVENQPLQFSEEGLAKLEQDLSTNLNPQIENPKQHIRAILTSAQTVLAGATKEIRKEAAKNIAVAIQVLTRTKEQEIPKQRIQNITVFQASFEESTRKPENLELAKETQLKGRSIAENSEYYNFIIEKNVPKSLVDPFFNKRADEERKILENPELTVREKETAIYDSRKKATRELLGDLKRKGYEVEELFEKSDLYVHMANVGSKVLEHDPGNYGAAVAADNRSELKAVLENSNLGFISLSPIFSMDNILDVESDVGAEAAATAQMMRDIEDMAREDQERQEEMEDQLEALKDEAEEKEGKETKEEKKTAIEEIMEQMEHVGELKSGPKEVPPGSGTMLGPFYRNPMEVVKQNNAKFTPQVLEALAAKNFDEAAFIAKNGDVDFSSPETPEAIVISYLRDSENTEKREAFVEVLKEPDNVAVRAALYEALAKTAVEISSA